MNLGINDPSWRSYLVINSKNHIFVAFGYSSHSIVYRSRDNGVNWNMISNFNDEQINIMKVGKNDNILIGTSKNIILSVDNGENWQNKASGISLNSNYIFAAAIDKNGHILLGTENGLYRSHNSIYTSVKLSESKTSKSFTLSQNYPNPFNPSTAIEFTLPKSELVELKVYNILGKEVSTLVSNKLNLGNHTYQFDGKNLSSGIYYYQLVAGDYREVKKMILLR